MTDGPYHSIGEVLSLLKEEHEDLTISKIRFLESQGLIEPERTPSGYRRFYDTDIDRLRWILSQQRDNFMPLKVIKRHLDTEGFDPAAEIGGAPDARVAAGTLAVLRAGDERVARGGRGRANRAEAAVEPEPAASQAAAGAVAAIGSVSLTAGELAEASGTDLGFVGELEKLGLIAPVASPIERYSTTRPSSSPRRPLRWSSEAWRSVTSACTRWPLIVKRASSPSSGRRRWPRVARLPQRLVTTSPIWSRTAT